MTFLSALTGRDGVRAATIEDPALPLTSQTLVDVLVGPKTDAGVAVTEKAALGLPAVYRAIALIADAAAGLPLHAFTAGADDTRKPLAPQPALLSQPHPDLTAFEWRELALVHLLAWGNAYVLKVRNGAGEVRELWPIEPARVRVGRDRTGAKVYAVERNGVEPGLNPAEHPDSFVTLNDDQVLHLPGLGYDGVVGLSPIRVARQSIGTALATQRHGARFFGSGTMLTGILSSDQKLTVDQAETVKARWKASNGGLDNAHDIAVLGSGTTFTPISIPPADAQFIETQRFGVTEVARLYGVPPHMLMDTEKSTSWGTGIEAQGIGFVTFTLQPWLIRFEQRLDRLMPEGAYLKHNVAGLLRGDAKARFESYAQARQWGWLSVNDVRRLEDLPPVAGGDAYMQPLNMTAIDATAPAPAIEGTPDA